MISSSTPLSLRVYARASRILPGIVAGCIVLTQVGMRIRGGG
jgi:hypothetical protein